MNSFASASPSLMYEIIRADAQHVTRWSGGETRELYLAPAGASYAARNFALRLSSATVEVDESTFTDLPHYVRDLMPLEGTVRLQHDDGDVITLTPFETDRFFGDQKTKSWGRCRDFNVMMRDDLPYSVSIERVPLDQGVARVPELCRQDFFYAIDADFTFHAIGGNRGIVLHAGDLLHTENGDNSSGLMFGTTKKDAVLLRVKIELG